MGFATFTLLEGKLYQSYQTYAFHQALVKRPASVFTKKKRRRRKLQKNWLGWVFSRVSSVSLSFLLKANSRCFGHFLGTGIWGQCPAPWRAS